MFNFFLLIGLVSVVSVVSTEIANAEVPEVKDGKRAYAPMRHKKYFQRERELFGYNPKFMPGTISFDTDNRPYIISNAQKNPVIQTLNKNGKWIKLDFCKAIKVKFPNWNGYIKLNQFSNRRIIFDADGDAYFLVSTGRSNLKKMLLLYSKDKCHTWQVYKLPYLEYGNLEVNDTFNLQKYPPPMLFYSIRNRPKGELLLMLPEKQADGSLKFSKPIVISKDAAATPLHSGDANYCISVKDNIHVVWTSNKSVSKRGNTHFAATYNRKTGKLSTPIMVGVSNEYMDKVDNHCQPAITVDSKGYLHVILGTHHYPAIYVRSTQPNSVEKWTKGKLFGTKKKKAGEGSYTYPSINCDKFDNIHTISRWAGYHYYFTLAYNRRSANGVWQRQQILVYPFRHMYGSWYHKVSIDKAGRLFVYYISFLHQLNKKSLEVYNQRWPEDKISLNPVVKNKAWDKNIKPHDPAILMTDDAGKRWFLATTPDFVTGVGKNLSR